MKTLLVLVRISLILLVCVRTGESARYASASRKLSALVPTPALVLDYHGGRLLSGRGSLYVYLIWYGNFTSSQKSIITDFIDSLSNSSSDSPSAAGFWKIVSSYTDASSNHVKSSVKLGGQVSVGAPLGNKLLRSDFPRIISTVLAKETLPAHPKSVYFLLTAADVAVERFCMNTCAMHSYMNRSLATRGPRLPYAWVGNSAVQCPGTCAWPFALPQYGPRDQVALVPPNGDVGVDGMVINMAFMLAGAATNPFGDGYYQGDARVPQEAGTACTGIFGTGSYPGYPGELLVDKASGSSYNAHGVRDRRFLLPAVWSPSAQACSASF